tara:strand:- start:11278 stop:11718 length:441 start_codon:yes stop_codon:yes gene_type:complete
MLLDKFNTFAYAAATGNTGTSVVGDVVDTGDVVRDLGAGQPIYLIANVDTAIAAGAGGTYQVVLTHADDAALTTNAENIVTSVAIDAAAGIEAGTRLITVALPSVNYKRYLGVREIVAGANTTAGKINAFLTLDANSYKAYAQADK